MDNLPILRNLGDVTGRIYLSWEEPFSTPEFRLGGVGVHEVMAPGLYRRPHGADCWIIMHFHDDAQCLLAGVLADVGAGSTVIWRPGVAHSFGHPTREWDHSWTMISGHWIDEQMRRCALPLNRVLEGATGPVVVEELGALMTELLDHLPPDREILQARLVLLLRRLRRVVMEDAPGNLPPALRGIPRFLEQNLHRPLTLEEIAGRSGLGISRFSEVFTQHLGLSPMRYLEKRRMHHAARLLRDRGLRVGEVADQLGYRDPLYFSRRFRKIHGVSPDRYRRSTD